MPEESESFGTPESSAAEALQSFDSSTPKNGQQSPALAMRSGEIEETPSGDLIDETGEEKAPALFPIAKQPGNLRPQGEKAPAKEKPPERDYSIFPEADRPILKQMSNAAFERHKELVTKLKELESRPPQEAPKAYYDHPEAYTLQEDYANAVKELDGVEDELDLWREQLIAVESGKPFKLVVKDKDGRWTTAPNLYQPSPEIKVKIGTILAELSQKKINAENSVKGLKDSFTNTITTARTSVETGMKQAFPWLAKPDEFKNRYFEAPGVPKKTIAELHSDFEKMMPVQFRSGPTMDVAKNLFASVHVLKAELSKLAAENAQLKALGSERSNKLPTSGAGTRKAKAQSDTLSYDLPD